MHKNELTIWGESVPHLKGKTTRTGSTPVQLDADIISPIPRYIMKSHREIICGMDVMKANGIPFLTTISRTISYGTAAELPNLEILSIFKSIEVMVSTYAMQGFTILAIGADNAFEPLLREPKFLWLRITLNITSEDEHEPYSERFNRTLKER